MSGYQSKRDAAANKLQEPVANLWECLGRWSAYLVQNGKQADCAPPSWLVDAITNATTPPQRQPLSDDSIFDIADYYLYNGGKTYGVLEFARAIEATHGIKENT